MIKLLAPVYVSNFNLNQRLFNLFQRNNSSKGKCGNSIEKKSLVDYNKNRIRFSSESLLRFNLSFYFAFQYLFSIINIRLNKY